SIAPECIPSAAVYLALPWGIAGALLLVAALFDRTNGIAVFAIAGLACSGFFPMTVGYGHTAFPELVTIAPGWLIAAYPLRHAIAAFGGGALDRVVSLSVIFGSAAILAGIMAVLATRVVTSERAAAPT